MDIRRTCATMTVHQHHAETDATYRLNRRAIESFSLTARLAERTSVLRIPVVVHVLYHTNEQNISDAQIKSQLDVLNQDFRLLNEDRAQIPAPFAGLAADAQLEFALAVRAPDGTTTTGITRTSTPVEAFLPTITGGNIDASNLDVLIKRSGTGHRAWPSDSYLNLWVCDLGSELLGYGTFPGIAAADDGVVIHYRHFGTIGTVEAPYDLGRTATHEIGH